MTADAAAREGALRVPRRLAAVLSLGLPTIALIAVQAGSPAAQRLPTGPARFDLAASWLAVQPGALPGAVWAPATAGRVQLGVLLHAAQAVQDGTVVAAAALVLLVLAAAQAVLLWALLRRSGCNAVTAGLATAAFGIAPAAVAAHAAVSVAAVAGVWLLAAALLATRTASTPRALAGAAAVLAVASYPPALLPAAAGAVVLVRRRPGSRPLLLGAGAASAVLLAIATVVGALPGGTAATQLSGIVAAQPLVAIGAAALVAWAVADPVGLLVAVVALVVLARRGGPALAVAAVLVAITAIWPGGADPTGPLVLLLVVAGLATGLTAERAAVALLAPVFRRSLIGSAWLTGVAALVLVGVVVALLGLPQALPRPERSVAQAQRWLAGSVPAGQVVLVGLGAWPDLASDSGAEVGWYAGRPGAVPSSVPWSRAGYVVTDASLDRADGTAAAVLERSATVARFGRGADALTVRAVEGAEVGAPSASAAPAPQPTPTAPTDAAERRAAAARIDAGRQLAGNPRIELSGRDRALLAAGEVDARIALVLAQFATSHRVVVESFGVQRGDDSGLRTTVLISEVDGRRVPADVARTGDLLRFLSALRDDFAARSIDATERGVTASFTPDPSWAPSS